MEHHGYGAASLMHALKGIQFPISKEELLECYGDNRVDVTKGTTLTVREILSDCTHDTYETMNEIVTCTEVEHKLKAA